MKLSEVMPFDKLRVGDKVISARGTPGVISELIKDLKGEGEDQVTLSWDNGNKSYTWMYMCDRIEYIGRDECN